MNDKYGQIQEQRLSQEQRQTTTVSQQQLLHAQLVELPINQLIERIKTEMDDNPALEASPDHQEYGEAPERTDDTEPTGDDYDTQRDREDRQSALDDALQSIGRDDEDLPVYHGGSNVGEEREDIVYGASTTFYDQLNEQTALLDISEEQRKVMEYLIGSLDDDGLLRKPLEAISDELAIYNNIDLSPQQIEQVLKELQQLDPAGIGARSLQECLTLQIERRDDSRLKELMLQVVGRYYEEFTHKHWTKIQRMLKLNDLQAETLFRELRRLNPKPGNAMSEVIGHSIQQITPDFIVETQEDGTVTFSLNQGEMPQLQVSESFAESVKAYQQGKEHMTRQAKEALLYISRKIEAAEGFIEAVKTRRQTLITTMQAIIQWQHQFFVDGEEASLKPMILKDIADRTGLNLSTISRVSNSKYAQTRWGTFPLRHFFSDGYVNEQGEERSTRQVKAALRELIDNEDKHRPLGDEELSRLLTEKGYPVARRTITKYRVKMNIPASRLRKN